MSATTQILAVVTVILLGAGGGVGAYLAYELRAARSEMRWLRSAHRHAREQLRETKHERDRYKRLAERLIIERAHARDDWSMQ